jgi:hypothetical protein
MPRTGGTNMSFAFNLLSAPTKNFLTKVFPSLPANTCTVHYIQVWHKFTN